MGESSLGIIQGRGNKENVAGLRSPLGLLTG
jgi:hypothetical protein